MSPSTSLNRPTSPEYPSSLLENSSQERAIGAAVFVAQKEINSDRKRSLEASPINESSETLSPREGLRQLFNQIQHILRPDYPIKSNKSKITNSPEILRHSPELEHVTDYLSTESIKLLNDLFFIAEHKSNTLDLKREPLIPIGIPSDLILDNSPGYAARILEDTRVHLDKIVDTMFDSIDVSDESAKLLNPFRTLIQDFQKKIVFLKERMGVLLTKKMKSEIVILRKEKFIESREASKKQPISIPINFNVDNQRLAVNRIETNNN